MKTIPINRSTPNPLLSAASIIIIFIISLRFLAFQGLPSGAIDALEIPLFLFFIASTSLGAIQSRYPAPPNSLRLYVIALVGLPILSFIPAYFIHDQSFIDSALVQRSLAYWLFYFYLHQRSMSERTVITAIGLVAILWCTITIGQQFTYPRFWFLGRVLDNVETPVALRAGVYRFMIPAPEYSALIALFCINRFLTSRKVHWIVFSAPFLVGIYFYGTRQVTFSVILAVGFLTLSGAAVNIRKYAPAAFGFLILTGISIVYFWEQVFGEFAQMTADDASTDNIRVKAFHYFVLEHWDGWINPIFGNGVAHKTSAYGQQIMALKWSGFFQSDIGIFGAFSTYGIIYVLAVFAFLVKSITKPCAPSKIYLRAYFVYTLITVPLSAQFSSPFLISFFCAVIYLHDKSNTDQHGIDSVKDNAVFKQH